MPNAFEATRTMSIIESLLSFDKTMGPSTASKNSTIISCVERVVSSIFRYHEGSVGATHVMVWHLHYESQLKLSLSDSSPRTVKLIGRNRTCVCFDTARNTFMTKGTKA